MKMKEVPVIDSHTKTLIDKCFYRLFYIYQLSDDELNDLVKFIWDVSNCMNDFYNIEASFRYCTDIAWLMAVNDIPLNDMKKLLANCIKYDIPVELVIETYKSKHKGDK